MHYSLKNRVEVYQNRLYLEKYQGRDIIRDGSLIRLLELKEILKLQCDIGNVMDVRNLEKNLQDNKTE